MTGEMRSIFTGLTKAREPHDSCNILLFTHFRQCRLTDHNLTLPFPFTGSRLSSQHGNEAAVDIVGVPRQSLFYRASIVCGLALSPPHVPGHTRTGMADTTTTGQYDTTGLLVFLIREVLNEHQYVYEHKLFIRPK